MEKRGKGAVSKIAILFFVAMTIFCGWMMAKGIGEIKYYNSNKDAAVEIDAVVCYVVEKTDSDDDDYYENYLYYEYDGKIYNRIEWKDTSSREYHIGDEVKVKILPQTPNEIFHEKSKYYGSVWISVVFMSILFAFIMSFIRKRLLERENLYIGDKILLTEFIAVTALSKGLFCMGYLAGAAMLFTLWTLAGMDNAWPIATGLGVFGIALHAMGFCNIKMYKKEHNFKIDEDVCYKTDVESDSDGGDTHYGYFRKYGKRIVGKFAENENYYILYDEKGRYKEVYSCDEYIPGGAQFDDENHECEKLWLKTLALNIVLPVVYVLIIVTIANM